MARASDANFLQAILRDQTFHMRLIRRVMLLAGTFVLISTAILALFYHYILGRLVEGTGPMLFAADDIQRLDQQMPALGGLLGSWMLIMLLINLALTAAVSLYIIRKLGSPLLAIKRALGEVAEGKLDVRLRASDATEFQEVTEALNRAMEQVQSKVHLAKEQARLGGEIENQPTPDADEIRRALQNCHQALSYFHTDGPHTDGGDSTSQADANAAG